MTNYEYCFRFNLDPSIVKFLNERKDTWDVFPDPDLKDPMMLIFRHHASGDKIQFTVDSEGKVLYTMLNEASVWEPHAQELRELIQAHQVVDYQAKRAAEAKQEAFQQFILNFGHTLDNFEYPELPPIEPLAKELTALMLQPFQKPL
jgi:hypothetical protein